MIPDDSAVETFHLGLHINQEQSNSKVFTVIGHISGVDPTTNKIKCVIPTWTNDTQTYMETGWIPLGTMKSGNQEGIQILPFGGATVTDLTGQVNNPNAAPEQVLIHVLGQKKAFYVVGVQTFNLQDVPPSGYQDKSGVAAQAGEWLFKHATGDYLYFSNDNTVKLISLTNPAPVLQTDTAPGTLDQTLVLASQAIGQNSNTNGDTVNTVNSNVTIIADSAGGSATANSNLSLTAQQTNAETTANNTASTILESLITTGAIGQANLDLKANSQGADIDQAQFTLEAKSQSVGTANGTINIDAGNLGTGQLDINVKGITATMNILVDGITNVMNITVTQGVVNVITDIVNVDCLEANVTAATSTTVETGTLTATVGTEATVTSPQTNIISGIVTLGDGTATQLLNQVSAAIYNAHDHIDPQGGVTGPPNQLITPAVSCINVFGS